MGDEENTLYLRKLLIMTSIIEHFIVPCSASKFYMSIPPSTSELGVVVTPVLQMRLLKPGEVKSLNPSHLISVITSNKCCY